MNWKEKYIQERNRFDTGWGQFYSLRGIVMLFVIIDMWIKQRFNYDLNLFYIIILGILSIILFWAIGLAWDKIKMYHYNAEFSNRRNPTIQKIKKKVLNS